MFKKKIILFTSSLLTLIIGCDEKLPEPTQNGANTFACKLNGKTWIADGRDSFKGQTFSVFYSDQNKPKYMFLLNAYRIKDKDNTSIMLALSDVKTTGTHHFNFNTVPYPDNLYFENHAAYIQNKPVDRKYITNNNVTGYIRFTRVDPANRIFAGTFEFNSEDINNKGEIIRVTNGRFDIKY